MKPAYFGQCPYCPNFDKNNYPEETELDTNPSLTLARNLTLSTGERILAISRPVVVTTPRLLILHIWIHQKIWGGIQSLDHKSICDEKSQLHETDAQITNMTEIGPAGNRSLTTYIKFLSAFSWNCDFEQFLQNSRRKMQLFAVKSKNSYT